MNDTIQIGRRFVPLEHVVLLEPFDAAAQTRLFSDKPYQTRVVLIDRDSVLTEEPLATLAERHSFRMLPEDDIATNTAIHFSVEAFERAEGFTPNKPYKSRLLWRGPGGEFESKLLLTEPEKVLAVVVRGAAPPVGESTEAPKPVRRKRRRASIPAPV
jgi:hypothetical protein